MGDERRYHEEQMLLGRDRNGSWSSEESYTLASDVEMDDLEDTSLHGHHQTSIRPEWLKRRGTNSKINKAPLLQPQFSRQRRKRSRYHRLWRLALHLPYLFVALLVVTGVLFPSYTTAPQRYNELRQRVLESTREGAANPHNEKVFIAASLYDRDGGVLQGDWGQSVLHLINILGHDNVFVSIYENDPSEKAMLAMSDFRERLPCQSSVVQDNLETSDLNHVFTSDGTQRLKRMAFLADVRNRALRPLEDESSEAYDTNWDKLLYLNDVVFDPIDAANLLFSTNVNERNGRTDYRAACSLDFINPFKFYDTFATRDLEGYTIGVPFYPWFKNSGEGQSRNDVLAQKDAVRVKSCWGGMVAFEAKWFQQGRQGSGSVASTGFGHPSPSTVSSAQDADLRVVADSHYEADNQLHPTSHGILARSTANATTSPLRFRSEPDTFWDASECCLIHADLAYAANSSSEAQDDTGIYMNPYIRVAYSRSVLAWLPFTRRFERLYTHFHTFVNWIGLRPSPNPRQFEQPGEEVVHQVWRWDDSQDNTAALTGSWVEERSIAMPGMFCGDAKLLYIREGEQERTDGKNWAIEPVPDAP